MLQNVELWKEKEKKKEEEGKAGEKEKEKDREGEEEDEKDKELWHNVKWEFCRKRDITPREYKAQKSWEPKCIMVKETDPVHSTIT